jgi:hypothetical protein
VTGSYPASLPNPQASVANDALNEHDRLLSEISLIRSRAAKEKQLSRRVELNLDIQRLTAKLNSIQQSLNS